MRNLQGAFRETLEGTHPEATIEGGAGISLEARLSALCARGHAAFPSLALDDERFVRHLARCAAGGREGPAALEELAIEDLFLACACAESVPGAVEAFEKKCARAVRAAIASLTSVANEQQDIEQLVRMTVFVGSPGASPKIASYLGRGSIVNWVGVVARRIGLATARSRDVVIPAPHSGVRVDTLDGRAASIDPVIALVKEQYRGPFQRALEEAIGKLVGRPRLLLRLHLVDGVSTVQLGKMFGVTQPTASRWVTQAREEVGGELRRLLSERLALEPPEIESLAGLVASQLDLSLSTLLASR